VWWLCAAAEGPAAFSGMQGFLGSIIGKMMLFGWSVALFYHLCNGLRHLWWDSGRGLDLPSVYRGGYIVLGGTAALTVIAWIAVIVHGRH
jgi:succinate dehydrogenase / fumarate reductase cytochrome b subunit